MTLSTDTGTIRIARLTPGLQLVTSSQTGVAHLVRSPYSYKLGQLTTKNRDVLGQLAGDGVAAPVHTPAAGGDERTVSGSLLQTLFEYNLVETTLSVAGTARYTVHPSTSVPQTRRTLDSGTLLELSRFAVLRRDGGELLVESPCSTAQFVLHDESLISDVIASSALGHIGALLRADLVDAGILVPCDSEDRELRTAQWSGHELWFHHRSRQHRGAVLGTGYGSTGWSDGWFDQPVKQHPGYGGESHELPTPDLASLRSSDMTLTAAIEDRRSGRDYDDARPITVQELGHWLYRTARARDDTTDQVQPSRPYPSGGALYELELYPLVRTCDGVPPGLFHYEPYTHTLHMVPAPAGAVAGLLCNGSRALAGNSDPQVLVIMSARFGRLMTKYEAIGYSLVLKHVGVLSQTMYLIATTLGLAGCALGTGDSELFALATSTDPLLESTVGEFALGSRPGDNERSDS